MLLAAQKRPHPLALRYACWSVRRVLSGPLRDLPEPDLVLHGIAVDGDREFRHRAGVLRIHVILPELRHGDGDRLVQALGVHIDAMEDAVRIGEGNAAAGTGVAFDYSAMFAFCSPSQGLDTRPNGYKNGYSQRVGACSDGLYWL